MDPLRAALLIIGLFIIGSIFVWGWMRSRPPKNDEFDPIPLDDELPPEPLAGGGDRTEDIELEGMQGLRLQARAEPVVGEELSSLKSQQSPDAGEPAADTGSERSLLISLTVMAAEGRHFHGPELLEAFDGAGLYFGDYKIFHAPVDLEKIDGPKLFSVANILEPGTLEPDTMADLRTPGLILFGQLPARIHGSEVLNFMVATGRHLAKTLGGTLCDGRRRPLTDEVVRELRHRVEREIGDRTEVPDDDM